MQLISFFSFKKKTCIIYFLKTLGGLKGQHSFHYLLQSLLFSVQMEVFVTHACHILESETAFCIYIVYICIYQLMYCCSPTCKPLYLAQ